MNVSVVGAGIFGITAALKMRARGHEVTIFDPGPIPHPLAESTDISKVVRMDYGADEDYTELGERSLRGWRVWNNVWKKPLFHETGVMFLTGEPMRPGGFEHDSYAMLTGRGYELERLDGVGIARRFPTFRPGALVDGYYNPNGGWAESGAVVEYLSKVVHGAGIKIENREIRDLAEVRRDLTIVCAGAWVPRLVPELAGSIRAIGQPVFHLRPKNPELYTADKFPVFGADIAKTGYYGFPVNADGIVKIANHGTGIPIARDEDRIVREHQDVDLRAFLAATLPGLRDAPIVHRRLCVYADTLDGHFWIARHPTDESLVVATGGSGHAFKFAPALGALIASIVLDADEDHPLAHKFRWRPELATLTRGDAARADR